MGFSERGEEYKQPVRKQRRDDQRDGQRDDRRQQNGGARRISRKYKWRHGGADDDLEIPLARENEKVSEEELRKHFKDNKEVYEKGLKPSVFEHDNLPISFNSALDVSSAMAEIDKTKTDNSTASAMRSESLKARAKDLGIQGNINGMKDETLEIKIREREQTLATIEANKK